MTNENLLFLGLAAVAGVYLLAKQSASAVGSVLSNELNPVSPNNLIYRGANVLTGGTDGQDSIGTRIYDAFNTVPPILSNDSYGTISGWNYSSKVGAATLLPYKTMFGYTARPVDENGQFITQAGVPYTTYSKNDLDTAIRAAMIDGGGLAGSLSGYAVYPNSQQDQQLANQTGFMI